MAEQQSLLWVYIQGIQRISLENNASSSKIEIMALFHHPIATMSVLLALPAGKGSGLPNNSLKCIKSDWREKRKLPWVILESPTNKSKEHLEWGEGKMKLKKHLWEGKHRMFSQVTWRPLVFEYLIRKLRGNKAPKYLKTWSETAKILRCLKREVIFCFRVWKCGTNSYFPLHVFKICLISHKPRK